MTPARPSATTTATCASASRTSTRTRARTRRPTKGACRAPPHCGLCRSRYLNNDDPVVCPGCVGRVRTMLDDLGLAYVALWPRATNAADDGKLAAAAPIPGGTAHVLVGPFVRMDILRTSREMANDHLRSDPMPPLSVLAQWESIWRAAFGLEQPAAAPTMKRALRYLRDHLTDMSRRASINPSFVTFARSIRRLRDSLEQALHDERKPEVGVECFECGDRLIRRFKAPRPCSCGPRPSQIAPIAVAAWEAKHAGHSQGGLDSPAPAEGWECPGCGQHYDPHGYLRATRQSLFDTADGDGWVTLPQAAETARDIAGRPVTPKMIRAWVERGDEIGLCSPWTSPAAVEPLPYAWEVVPGAPQARHGGRAQLAWWPDVLDRALNFRRRGRRSQLTVAN